MAVRFLFDPEPSRLSVQAFAAGLLSAFAHSPTFAARRFSGDMEFTGSELSAGRLRVEIEADSLETIDSVSASDRAEIERRMRDEVLETGRFPTIVFHSDELTVGRMTPDRGRLRIIGSLQLHGVSRRIDLEPDLFQYEDGVRVVGEAPLTLSQYRIRPVTALAGAVRLKDQVKVKFDLAAWRRQD